MPARKGVKTLESSTLKCIGDLFKSTCRNLASTLTVKKELDDFSGSNFASLELSSLFQRESIRQIQKCFFEDTAHYFHSHITKEIIVAISDLHKQTILEHRLSAELTDSNFLSNVLTSEVDEFRRQRHLSRWKKEKWQIDFIQVLCHPAIKEIDISRETLGSRYNLHWAVVARLCSLLIHIPNLERLNIGSWSCKRFGLLTENNQNEGWQLKYLPRLEQISVSDVTERFFQNVGLHCPKLVKLQVYSSDITDQVTSWVSKCRRLELVELLENRDVTPVAFAQLLRANVDLKSLGRCDCFAQVLSLLYDRKSMYRRSVSTIPEHLNLEEVNSSEKLSSHQLHFLVRFCPNLKRVRLTYLPTHEFTNSFAVFRRQQSYQESEPMRIAGDDSLESDESPSSQRSDDFDMSPEEEDDEDMHLARLCTLDRLEQLSIASADFFGHLLFRLLEVRGDQLTHLEMRNIDELNLNAVLLIGARCTRLQHLGLHGCHFQIQPDDTKTVDELCNVRRNIGFSEISLAEDRKRPRLSSSCLTDDSMDHFRHLETFSVYLNTPTYLPIVQYILSHAVQLQKFSLSQFFTDFDEAFVTQTLFQWNPMLHLREFDLPEASNLSLVAVNVIIHNCPNLQRLRRISNWGKIDPDQIRTIRKEIKARNFDLIIDDGDDSDQEEE